MAYVTPKCLKGSQKYNSPAFSSVFCVLQIFKLETQNVIRGNTGAYQLELKG
jgi:hypothetical protein